MRSSGRKGKQTLQCPSNKKIFLSLQLAEEALLDSHQRNHYKGSGPINVYLCQDCGYYHFTSKGEINLTLKQQLQNGAIEKGREALWWESKLKGR